MRLRSLAPTTPGGKMRSAAESVQIVCCVCGERAAYLDAQIGGWVADADGEPFRAYYCADCKPTIQGEL